MVVELPYQIGAGERPPGSMAPGTVEQWAHDFAINYANKLANGTINGAPGSLFTNETFAQFGLNPFDPTDIGSGIVSGSAYNQLFELGQKLASGGFSQLTPQQRVGLTDPSGLPSGTAAPSDVDKNNMVAIALANLQEAGLNERQAAALANQMSIAQLQEAGASSRNAASIAAQLQIAGIESADRRYSTDVNAAVAREDIASRERIAGADIASREGIADKDRAESARQFDLGLGEDRRQFNASLMFELFDRGIQLMQNPVDWLGYQYWLGNIGAPINALTLSSAAAIGGAIPPSGPSGAGPMIGGPAVLDGDFSGAQELGITNAGPVTIAEAVQMNPGGTVFPDTDMAAINTVQAHGGPDQMDEMLAEARMTELPAAGVSPQFSQMATVISGPAHARVLSRQGVPAPPPLPDAGMANPGALGAGATQQQPAPMDPGIPGGAPGGVVSANPPMAPVPPAPLPSTAGAQPAPAPPPLPNLAGAQPGSVGGIFTGNEAGGTMESAAAGAGGVPGLAPSSNIEQLLGQLANELGIPIDQLRTIFPAHLMPQQATNQAIANSPVIQMLRNGSGVSAFNTGPQTGSPFTSIAGPEGGRIEVGVRGGQDVNATSYLTALPSVREQTHGVINAMGQNLPDFAEQMYRSSPITNITPGSYGRRRFGN